MEQVDLRQLLAGGRSQGLACILRMVTGADHDHLRINLLDLHFPSELAVELAAATACLDRLAHAHVVQQGLCPQRRPRFIARLARVVQRLGEDLHQGTDRDGKDHECRDHFNQGESAFGFGQGLAHDPN